MYQVWCDSYLLYDDSLESLKIYGPTISTELNVVGSFSFTIYPDHPYFERLHKLKSIIKVYQDSRLIFKGRILSDINGFYNEKKVTCESDLAFLLDSIQRPYEFQGTISDLLRLYLESHNGQVSDEQKFKLGHVTVTDPNDYIHRGSTEYPSTFDEIKAKLIDILGGYLWVRYEEDGTYLDYIEDFDLLSNQKIEFGKNLLEFANTVNANDIFTVIIPLGASVQDEAGEDVGKLTIESVNDGKDYIEHEEGIRRYGKIVKVVNWDDVNIPSNLKTKAEAYLNNAVMLANTIELTAADLSSLNNNINAFHLGTKVRIISKPHNIDTMFLVNKLSINLLNPAESKLQLGASSFTMTESQKNEMKDVMSQVVTKTEDMRTNAVNVMTKQMQSSIESSSSEILTKVSEEYYAKGETDELIESKTTSLRQDVDGWIQTWTTFQQTYEDDKEGTDAHFEKIERYIRYVDGKIYLGEVGNALELRISNDELGFYQDNIKVAYFNNNRMYITDGEFTNSLQLGKFAFLPRSNGNLSFKKVKD